MHEDGIQDEASRTHVKNTTRGRWLTHMSDVCASLSISIRGESLRVPILAEGVVRIQEPHGQRPIVRSQSFDPETRRRPQGTTFLPLALVCNKLVIRSSVEGAVGQAHQSHSVLAWHPKQAASKASEAMRNRVVLGGGCTNSCSIWRRYQGMSWNCRMHTPS